MTQSNYDSGRPNWPGPKFDAIQLDLPLGFRPSGAVGRASEDRVEWRCAQKVLAGYLDANGVLQPSLAARDLLAEFGSIPDLLSASWWRLRRVAGSRLATTIRASHELMRASLSEPIERGPVVPRSRELVSFLQIHMGFLQHERLIAIYVDSRQRLILIEKIADGRFGEVAVDFRRIINCGLSIGASGFLLVHNHPSGIPSPSEQDLSVSSRLRALASDLELHLLDHLIIARGQVGSVVDFWREGEWSRGQSCERRNSKPE